MLPCDGQTKALTCSGMVQTFATTPTIIYNVLANDATFSNLLGTYTFKGGSSVDSIAVLTPGQSLPLLESQVGLECIIHDSGDIRRKDYVSDSSNFMITWRLFLIAWDPSDGSNLTVAAKRLMHLFNGATCIETLAAAQGLRARVQTMVMIPEEAALHPDAEAVLAALP